LLKGRFFNDHDDAYAPRVLIVNKAFAEKFFPREDVIGKRITPGASAPGEKDGIVREIVWRGGERQAVRHGRRAPAHLLLSLQAASLDAPVVMLRTAVPPRTLESAVREQMAALDSMVPVFQVSTMEELLSTQVTEPRFHTVLLGCFAGSPCC